MYINLASTDKKARAAQINTDIGASGTMRLYTGSAPPSPDYPATGTLLVALPLSSPAAVASYSVQSATINTPGSGGTSGAQLVAGTTGTGVRFQAAVNIVGGVIASITSLVIPGTYSLAPTLFSSEPVVGGGVTGATFSLVLTGQLIFNSITQAVAIASGLAGYARISAIGGSGPSQDHAVGIIDLDCGISNAAVTMNTISIVIGAPVLCSTEVLTEA
jgi:hypothetical protein